jgi:3-phenylpropionate/trans-cinnamate dioxygenase ferredoxin reductase subunit
MSEHDARASASKHATLLIVGASYAGAQLAGSAREAGFGGRIVLCGDEPHLPYQRPHLSKGYLSGALDATRLPLRSAEYYRERDIELQLGARIDAIDPARRQVHRGAVTLDYDWLVLATGARARPLNVPGVGLQGVLTLRSLDDAERLRVLAPAARKVCVVGGGFIGLEVAAVLATAGAEVCVLETGERLLMRSLPAPLAGYLAATHAARGVTLHYGQALRALHGDNNGRVCGAELADGTLLPCDLVVTGIGVQANVELATAAGIACDDGIVVDAGMATSAPQVLAIGDCARQPHPWTPDPGDLRGLRLESIQAANEMARAAAATIMGRPAPPPGVPWFWSDQYDLKLQMAGLGAATDTLVTRGDLHSGKFTVWGLRGGRVAAAYSINRPGEHLLSRKLIAARCAVPPALLADPQVDLGAWLQSASKGA